MTGLKVVDDYTFTIKTTEKVSNLPVRLGYSAFAPLPDVFFDDPKAFGDKPIGAGPFKVDAWTKDQSIVLSKFADYSGEFGGQPRQGDVQDLPGPRRRLQRRPRQQPRRHRRDPGERADRRQVQDGPPRPQRAEGDWRHPERRVRAGHGRPELRRPEDPSGDLHGDRPRDDHQADLQRHPRARHRLGLPGRRRLQGRPVRRVLQVRPGQGQGALRRRPAASRATRSPSPTTPTPPTRTGPRPPATASSSRSVSSARPSASWTSRRSASRSATRR